METIRPKSDHKHSWVQIGAHTLHAGCKPLGKKPYPDKKLPVREVRLVSKCKQCNEVKVSISHHFCYAGGGFIERDKPRPRFKNPSTSSFTITNCEFVITKKIEE